MWFRWLLVVAMTAAAPRVLCRHAAGQQPATSAAPAAPVGPVMRYVDGSFGFALIPPAGCATIREKRFIDTADEVEIVRFVNNEVFWSLGVRQSKPERALDPDTLGEMIVQEVKDACPDAAVAKTGKSELGSREVLRCTVAMTSRGAPVIRQQAMIRVKPSEYFALILVTPKSDEKTASAVFEQVLSSFEVLRSEVQEQQLREALRRGSALLQLVRTGSIDVVGSEPREVFLRYLEKGVEIGFMQIRMEPRTVDRRKGITVFKWAWFFRPDDTITMMQQDMFVTSNLSFEKWASRFITLSAPPKGGGRREISQEIESGIRQDEKLLVGYAGKSSGRQITEKELDVDRTYASAPWDVLLPTILDLRKSELYAFSWYDGSRRGLSLQTFRIVGPKTTASGSEAILIEQSEGLIPPIHELYVDRSGQIVRVVMKVGDQSMEMLATTRRDIERRYGDRVREIEQLMPGPSSAPAGEKTAGRPDQPK